MNGVTVVSVLTGGTHLLAVLAEEALGAELIAPRPVPAPVAGDAAPLCHLTGLLALAVPAPALGPKHNRENHSHLSCLRKSHPNAMKLLRGPEAQ